MKIKVMNLWLDKQEAYHRKLGEDDDKIKEKVFADAMLQVKARIKNQGWDETYKYITEWGADGKGLDRVGPHALAMVYQKIKTKMWSVNNKSPVKLENEYNKLLSKDEK